MIRNIFAVFIILQIQYNPQPIAYIIDKPNESSQYLHFFECIINGDETGLIKDILKQMPFNKKLEFDYIILNKKCFKNIECCQKLLKYTKKFNLLY
jgi:hypothetical protein